MGGLTIPLVVAVLLALAVAYWWLARRRLRPQEPDYHFRCPWCRRRLHYRAHRVGHRGMCPQCRHEFIFPPPPRERTGNGKG
jgi:hypothetical protein